MAPVVGLCGGLVTEGQETTAARRRIDAVSPCTALYPHYQYLSIICRREPRACPHGAAPCASSRARTRPVHGCRASAMAAQPSSPTLPTPGTALVTHHTTLAHEDGSVSAILSVGKHLVGKLIGKAGATISSLQTSTGTSIQVDQVGLLTARRDRAAAQRLLPAAPRPRLALPLPALLPPACCCRP